ncbi:hypothetical protein CcaCcLH18_03714 [Colletotrichum camelliae]|nr:hypothetical protein CcaCcLH18_03714 [Colletotrichum camelliae]
MEKTETTEPFISGINDTDRSDTMTVPREVSNWKIYLYCMGVCLGAVALGNPYDRHDYDVSLMGGTLILPSFERDFGLNGKTQRQLDDITSNIVSCFQGGMFLGALASYPISDRWGRKWCITIATIIFLAGASIQIGSRGVVALIMAGRCIAGLGIGASAPVIPVYIAEIAPPTIRGKLVGFYEIGSQGAQMLGFWVNYAVNKIISPETSTQWTFPLGLQLLPGAILLVVLPFCPESLRWLCGKDRWDQAERILTDIRQLPIDHPYMAHEMREIRLAVEFEAHLAAKQPGLKGKLKDLKKKEIRNRLAIGLCLMIYYSPRIFQPLGIQSTDLKLFATGFYGVAKTLGMVIFSFWVADHFGRRKGLVWGAFVGAVPMRFWSYVISRSTPYMISDIGYGTYFFFGALMVCMGFWAWWCIRETKGVPIEEMDALFGAPRANMEDSEPKSA